MDQIDTSKTLEVAESKPKLVVLLLGGLVLSVAALTMVAGRWPERLPDHVYDHVMQWGSAILFPLATLAVLWRLARFRGAALVLSPAGFFDKRSFLHPLPWPAIRAVATESYRGGVQFVELTVEPAEMDGLFRQKRLERLAAPLQRLEILNKVLIGTQDLKIKCQVLFRTINAYWYAHNNAHEIPAVSVMKNEV